MTVSETAKKELISYIINIWQVPRLCLLDQFLDNSYIISDKYFRNALWSPMISHPSKDIGSE